MTDGNGLPGWPRGLSEPLAAAYVGLSQSSFGVSWRAGDAPQPVKLSARRQIWLREKLDAWLDAKAGTPKAPLAAAGDDPLAGEWDAHLNGHGQA